MPAPAADTLVDAIGERTPQGIAAAVSRFIRTGRYRPGDRLPTVRALAADLGLSPATVSEAFQALSAIGAISSRGRAGTFVRAVPEPEAPRRYRDLGAAPGPTGMIDLSTGIPDPDLLPDLRRAIDRLGARSSRLTTSYLDEPVLPDLEGVLRQSWPSPVDRITVVDGALDGLSRVVDQLVRFGDVVCVENPTFPPLIDLLERVGARLVPLSMDDEGALPDSLADALLREPVLVMLQPRAHNPTGISITPRRARRLADVLRGSTAIVVEDDHSGEIASAPLVSVGAFLPERTVHIRSYSKSHGPDLRIAAIGGPSEVMDPLISRRMLGPGWTSRLLQWLLLDLLTDDEARAAVGRARDAYAARRAAVACELRDRGIPIADGDGINLWVPVPDQRQAIVTLAAHGIRVAPGEPFVVAASGPDHVRVTTGLLQSRTDALGEAARRLAAALGDASRGTAASP